MSVQTRLDRLEQALAPRVGTDGPHCDVCGAPDSAIVYEGMHFRIVPDEEDDPTCAGCGRMLDRESGRPILAKWLMRLVRAKPPEGWEPRKG
jgi:hypothetical protein